MIVRTSAQFMDEVDSILERYAGPGFAAHCGPRDEPLPWDDDEPEDGFYSDVSEDDLPLPVSFPLGQSDEE